MSSGAATWQSRRLWSPQNHLALHLSMKKKNVNTWNSLKLTVRHELCMCWDLLTDKKILYSEMLLMNTCPVITLLKVQQCLSHEFTFYKGQRRYVIISYWHVTVAWSSKSPSGNFSVSPTGSHSINNILHCLVSLSLRSMEHVFSRWGWGDSGHGSNERGGIPQPRVNNFSNFRYAENPKQRDKIDNWSVIPWN